MKQTQAKSLAPGVKKNMLPDSNVDTVRCANSVHPYRGVQIALWAIPPLRVNRTSIIEPKQCVPQVKGLQDVNCQYFVGECYILFYST